MSHILFLLVLAFIVWRSLSKTLRRGKVVQPDAGQRASPRPLPTDAQRDEIADVVSSLLGGKSQELIEQAVSRAMHDSKARAEVGFKARAEVRHRAVVAMEPTKQVSKKTSPQAPARQRAKYLLDGDAGYRQRSDRTARLQQSFRGKGLCSPR